MSTLPSAHIIRLLNPFYATPDALADQLSTYLDLLLKWNARTNLTAIRDPEEIVVRHFGESLFAASHLPSAATLLDLGSGAGFPGLPIQLAIPHLKVTLAESQNKKAAFLREAVRTLGLSTEVWAARSEALPPQRKFDIVTLRAVDDPAAALVEAAKHLAESGTIAHLTATDNPSADALRLPGSSKTYLHLFR